jgi:hypothetical protein
VPAATAAISPGPSTQPFPRFVQLGRDEILDRRQTKSLREERLHEIPPLLVSDDCDLVNVLVVLGQKADVAPVPLALPAAKIIEDQQRLDPSPALNRLDRSRLYLAQLGLA